MSEEHKRYWVGINLVKGIGPARLKKLLNTFGEVRRVWRASPAALAGAGLSPKIIHNLIQLRTEIDLDKIWQDLQAEDIHVLTWLDENYPSRLREIEAPPPVLYIRGDLKHEDKWAVGIVGTRRNTGYGCQITQEVAAYLARNGFTIVSGLARGVDTIAHREAIKSGGRTLAVLGNGIDLIYPPENRRLAMEIQENGALISDYPPGTPPEAANFPPRNRIISGLSMALVVVEAGDRSGALITASFAADQGREVFAVPGNIRGGQSLGTNRLIQQGARLLLAPKEILEVLDMTLLPEHRSATTILPENAVEALLLEMLARESMHIDDLSYQTKMSVNEVSATLAMMELKGLVRKIGSMRYVVVP